MSVSNISHSAVVTETRRDAHGRETARIDGRGNVSLTRYDAFGRIVETIDALTNATAYAYDAMGRVAAITNALGDVTEYAYDMRGNRISERGATYPVDYTYDLYSNRIAMTTYRNISLANGDTTHWFYDESSGTLTNKVYADGVAYRYDYDDCLRCTNEAFAVGEACFDVMRTYDAVGVVGDTRSTSQTSSMPSRHGFSMTAGWSPVMDLRTRPVVDCRCRCVMKKGALPRFRISCPMEGCFRVNTHATHNVLI